MIEHDLRQTFKDLLEVDFDQEQIEELFENYLLVETYWNNFFQTIGKVELVILAEAPLSSDRYIYCPANEHDSGTQFLFKKTPQKCFQARHGVSDFSKGSSKIQIMRELGIIIIEAYPFSFDPKMHKMNFTNLKTETKIRLFEQSKSWHFSKKIRAVKSKATSQTIYGYRYWRNRPLLSLINSEDDFQCLGVQGSKAAGQIDEAKMIRFFN